jgi:alanyl-tRNA synthetase
MEKGYWQEPAVLEFEALVASVTPVADGLAVRLDATYFYPESGGQLADGGTVDGVRILTAQQDEGGPYVILPASTPIEVGARVHCVVDGYLRKKHSQLHTAQHVLSKLLDRSGIATLSFHMTDEDASIEVGTPSVDQPMLESLEDQVEDAICQCLPVDSLFVEPTELASYGVRKVPDLGSGSLRLVRIGDLDVNPCGGTHVRCTGEIGAFNIYRTDKVRGNVRLYFVAGLTATLYRRRALAALSSVQRQLTCGLGDVVTAVDRLFEQTRFLERESRMLADSLADSIARQLLEDAAQTGTALRVLEGLPGDIVRRIVARLDEPTGPICIMAYTGDASVGQFACVVPAGREPVAARLLENLRERYGAHCGGSGTHVQGRLDIRLDAGQLAELTALLQSAQ